MGFRLFACLFLLSIAPIVALQKIMILPVINADKDPNFAYLEASITDSLRQRLGEKLAFDELAEDKWTSVAEQNFILRDDLHTRTAAMNLGILANQDIVISGGFLPVQKKSGNGKTSIQTTVYLLDVKKKKIIATVKVECRPIANSLPPSARSPIVSRPRRAR